jgi:hypothetical protein
MYIKEREKASNAYKLHSVGISPHKIEERSKIPARKTAAVSRF